MLIRHYQKNWTSCASNWPKIAARASTMHSLPGPLSGPLIRAPRSRMIHIGQIAPPPSENVDPDPPSLPVCYDTLRALLGRIPIGDIHLRLRLVLRVLLMTSYTSTPDDAAIQP